MRKSRLNLAIVGMALTVFGLAALSCKSAEVGAQSGGVSSAGGKTSSGGGSSGTPVIDLDPLVVPPSDGSARGASDGGTVVVACTDGVDCTCPPFNVAVIGKPGKWGANPNGDSDTALQEWLNSSSAGTAKVANHTTKPTLTPDFLAAYNVIILASLSDDSNTGPFWSFDSSEIAAFRAWVENGGGVITLIGYSGDGGEINPVNQLIGFSGIAYNNEALFADCPNWSICGCAHSNPITTWNRTDPVIANLSNSITMVGMENGRSISAPADAHVAATVGAKNALVGKLVGKGHVLVYADEWITYTSQWNGEGNPKANDPSCKGFLPQDTYQTAQFWYNMIKWSQPTATCFKIVDSRQPVTIW
jgi:hypothetical protein